MRTLPLTYKIKRATKGLQGNVYKFPKKGAVLNQFGFNGQLKDNEIYGEGNAYTAEHWEYDPRSIRRWNVDPVIKHYESPYAVLGNNPILNIDINGNDSLVMHMKYMYSKHRVRTFLVTFSVIRNGLEVSLPHIMYAGNSQNSIQPKDNQDYRLKFQSMGSHPKWNKTPIFIDGILKHDGSKASTFIHPTNYPEYNLGCFCVSEQAPFKVETNLGDHLFFDKTENALKKLEKFMKFMSQF